MNRLLPLPPGDFWRDKDLWQLYGYILSRADEDGRWVVSPKEIQRDLGLSRQRLRTLMERMKSTAWLTAQSTARSTALTICNTTTKRKSATTKPTAKPTTQPTTKFVPPTDEDVAAYVAEKGYHFNPDSFVPHYQSKGWKVGDQPMKDWRAACRTWETKWKEKYGERFYYEVGAASAADNAASRKARRDRGLSLANKIVAGSENLLNLFNGGPEADPDTCPD